MFDHDSMQSVSLLSLQVETRSVFIQVFWRQGLDKGIYGCISTVTQHEQG